MTDTCDVNLGLADQFLAFALQRTQIDDGPVENHTLDRERLRRAFLRSGGTYRSLLKAFAQGYSVRAD